MTKENKDNQHQKKDSHEKIGEIAEQTQIENFQFWQMIKELQIGP